MKKLTLVLCTTAMLATSGIALAKKTPDRVTICHNGSTYNLETQTYDPISFLITVSSNAVAKHVANHGDLVEWQEDGTGEECSFVNGIVMCKEVTLCTATDTGS